MSDSKSIGRSVKRLEDRPLLMGKGRFVADLAFPDMLEGCICPQPARPRRNPRHRQDRSARASGRACCHHSFRSSPIHAGPEGAAAGTEPVIVESPAHQTGRGATASKQHLASAAAQQIVEDRKTHKNGADEGHRLPNTRPPVRNGVHEGHATKPYRE